jgi:hypothetical protein
MRTLLFSIFAFFVFLQGCYLDPKKAIKHEMFATNAETKALGRPVQFAVVGSTRSVLYGAKGEPVVPKELIADIRGEIPVRGIDFVVLTGGHVRRSTPDEWTGFGKRWKDVLKSSAESKNRGRKPVLPLAGDGEMLGDKRLFSYGTTFPDAGAKIGFNRVASWLYFDIDVGGTVWRLVTLDTHKGMLGSRWKEQLFWLPKVVSGDDFQKLIVFMPDPLITMVKGYQMNPNNAPKELLEVIEDQAGIMRLMAVVSGGPPSNEVYLPSGNFGEAYLVAGNAGITGTVQNRWGAADTAGFNDVALEPMFDLSLMKQFEAYAENLNFPEKVIDHAKGAGSWETYTAGYEASSFPLQGWWMVRLKGEEISLTYRMRGWDETFKDIYTMQYTREKGWVGKPL